MTGYRIEVRSQVLHYFNKDAFRDRVVKLVDADCRFEARVVA